MKFEKLNQIIDYYGKGCVAPQVLILGDSVMQRVSGSDNNKMSLGDMICEGLSDCGLSSYVVTSTAFHPVVELSLLSALRALPLHPRIVVVPINLRVFSSQWGANPSYRFAAERVACEQFVAAPGEGSPELVPQEVTQADWEEYDALPSGIWCGADIGLPTVGALRLVTMTNLQKARVASPFGPSTQEQYAWRKSVLFRWHYLSYVSLAHPQVQALAQIRKLWCPSEVRVVFFITPINMRAGLRFCGADFVLTVESACRQVAQVVGDNIGMRSVPSEHFFSEDDTTEHLNEVGRESLAKWVVEAVKLQDYYQRGEVPR